MPDLQDSRNDELRRADLAEASHLGKEFGLGAAADVTRVRVWQVPLSLDVSIIELSPDEPAPRVLRWDDVDSVTLVFNDSAESFNGLSECTLESGTGTEHGHDDGRPGPSRQTAAAELWFPVPPWPTKWCCCVPGTRPTCRASLECTR